MRVRLELFQIRHVHTEHLLNFARGAIAASNPNDFGRIPAKQRPFVEIRIFAYDRETLFTGVTPYRIVSRPTEAGRVNVLGAGE
jgi:hypothetical protein